MKNITLCVPSLDDYWYEQRVQSNPLSMNYNAGYDVSYYGYHYDTGCIDFPKEKWKESFERRKKEKLVLMHFNTEETYKKAKEDGFEVACVSKE